MDTNSPDNPVKADNLNPQNPDGKSINNPSEASSQPSPTVSPETSTMQPQTIQDTVIPVAIHNSKKGIPVFIVIFIFIFAFLAGIFSAAIYFQDQLQKSKAADDKNIQTDTLNTLPEKLIIATDPTAPPMESLNEQGGLVGYDVDLGYRIANELGVKAEFKTILWDNIFTALENKEIDMIMSSVTITDERKLKYNFSEPYINAGQVIVSRKDQPLRTVAELKGKKISVQKDTTNEKEAFKYTSPELVLSYLGFEEAAKTLANGQADAMISDLTLAKGFISKYDNLKITSDPFTNDYYGIVMHKDDTELKKKVDEVLSALKIKGILADLKQKWLE